MKVRYRFSDVEWEKIESVLPRHKGRRDGKGRPPKDPRQVLEGIVWILISGAPWHMLPKGEFPSYQTCHRYFQNRTKEGVIKKNLRTLSRFHAKGLNQTEMHFIDGSFAAAKRGGADVGKTKRGKGSRIMAVVNKKSRPVAVKLTSATPFEPTLVEDTLKERFTTTHKVKRLTGDKAYDSDPLHKKLKKKGVELNAPHKRNRKKKKTQDGRKLRHYKHKWVVERFFAWLQNFRRCLVRHERKTENFLSFIHLAIILMLLRYF